MRKKLEILDTRDTRNLGPKFFFGPLTGIYNAGVQPLLLTPNVTGDGFGPESRPKNRVTGDGFWPILGYQKIFSALRAPKMYFFVRISLSYFFFGVDVKKWSNIRRKTCQKTSPEKRLRRRFYVTGFGKNNLM